MRQNDTRKRQAKIAHAIHRQTKQNTHFAFIQTYATLHSLSSAWFTFASPQLTSIRMYRQAFRTQQFRVLFVALYSRQLSYCGRYLCATATAVACHGLLLLLAVHISRSPSDQIDTTYFCAQPFKRAYLMLDSHSISVNKIANCVVHVRARECCFLQMCAFCTV